ncbi:phage/plasmid replication protein, II/X family [Acinetobacter bereziniae]|uniref:phage/plasmid replication protein, II/X family n=1 Tax=Acinetobacter bereziniae TaxID=106648 RepID=UPI003AF7E7BD
MKNSNLDKAYKRIHEMFDKTTPTGRLSQVRSNHLISFVCWAVSFGLDGIKTHGSERTFKRYMNDLKKCSITEEFIWEEYEKEKFRRKNNKVEFVELKFDNQLPDWYEEPKSKYSMEDLINGREKS